MLYLKGVNVITKENEIGAEMRQRPVEQDRFERRNNFDAVEENLTAEQVKLEASRCLNCKQAKTK